MNEKLLFLALAISLSAIALFGALAALIIDPMMRG